MITIIGRENVGKSSIFNRLIEQKKALVSPIAGTTRDDKHGVVFWRGSQIEIIDTAGINIDRDTIIDNKVKEHLNSIIDRSEFLLFVVDVQTGILKQDREIAKLIQKKNIPYLLVVNKVDAPHHISDASDFNKLGLGEPFLISAGNGTGTGDLLDEIYNRLPEISYKSKYKNLHERTKISIIGQPNVGKSQLLNTMLGEDKVIVSEVAHTTREPNDIPFNYKKHKFLLIDTAGLRRKKQKDPLNKASAIYTLKSIRYTDVALLVIDATQDITSQDMRLAGKMKEMYKPQVLVINKWDLIDNKNTHTAAEFQTYYQNHFPFLKGVPMIFVSAKENQRVHKILDLVIEILEEMDKEVKPKELERFLKRIVKIRKPVQARGMKKPRIYAIEQIENKHCPFFHIVIGSKDTLHFSYLRFIENQLRDQYGFNGCPIKLAIIKRRKKLERKLQREQDQKKKLTPPTDE